MLLLLWLLSSLSGGFLRIVQLFDQVSERGEKQDSDLHNLEPYVNDVVLTVLQALLSFPIFVVAFPNFVVTIPMTALLRMLTHIV